jgi:hypothetical protein
VVLTKDSREVPKLTAREWSFRMRDCCDSADGIAPEGGNSNT